MMLTKKESYIVEMLRVNMTRKEIAQKLGISIYEVGGIVTRLVERSVIQRSETGKGACKVLLDTYDIAGDNEVPIEPKKGITLVIPDGYEDYIRGHYGIIPRRELARRLNLDKVTLNLMIIQLGLA
ncbi:helix-turn-helix transcriptional regulator [Cohnella thailandensis]|uniref:Uncharacterized protein n=1 Tax=Cohnella thailandensis TaxID=557557 RepID=A0A841SPN6_9BACL|nr:hypothetical protein [Cohnella thailandensis]MBB6632779.1 hypothetical protein [Cohnella thailandensis]MBP1975531.1 putative membrane protein [Cohnella thailandensis]